MASASRTQLLLLLTLLLLAAARTPGAAAAATTQQRDAGPLSAFLGLLSATAAPTVATYQTVHNHTHSLPQPLLQNGIVYQGSSARLRRVVSKLLRGEAVHVAALGAAITYGRGVQRGSSDWFTLFSGWLAAAFPAAQVTAANAAVPLAQSEYLSACLQQHVDTQADLVFVEVTAADGYLDASINNELVHAFERLVRQLLLLPNKPAVVVLNALHPSPLHNPQRANSSSSVGKQQPPQQQQEAAVPFYHTIEDHYGVVAQYYKLPSLSLRNAVWQGLQQGWAGFRAHELFTEVKLPSSPRKPQHTRQQPQQQQSQKQQQQHASSFLPSKLGHKYMSDLAIALLQHTFLQQVLRPLPPSDVAAADKLLVPMFPGNWEGHGRGCAAGLDLRAAVKGAEHRDWYFVTEGSPDRPAWGFVSHTPNATLVLQLDTRSRGSRRAFATLTTDQKVQLLERHGYFMAALDLEGAEERGGTPPVLPVQTAEQTVALEANQKIWGQGADGLESATAEAERQATLAAAQLKLAQGMKEKPYVNSERIMGANPFSALQLSQEARMEVGRTKTATGVEVILSSSGDRRLQQAAGWQQPDDEQQEQQQLEECQHAAARAWAAAPRAAAAAGGAWHSLSRSSSSSSSSRELAGVGTSSNPQVMPPPYDAVFLKPGSGNSSSASTPPPGTVGASVFNQYITRPAPSMLVLVGFLRAHHLMGRARMWCMSGCSCQEVVVDAWHTQHQHRLATARLAVTQSAECLIGVQVLPESSSGHHKFKVTGLMLAQAVHYRTPDSLLTHQYFMHSDLL